MKVGVGVGVSGWRVGGGWVVGRKAYCEGMCVRSDGLHNGHCQCRMPSVVLSPRFYSCHTAVASTITPPPHPHPGVHLISQHTHLSRSSRLSLPLLTKLFADIPHTCDAALRCSNDGRVGGALAIEAGLNPTRPWQARGKHSDDSRVGCSGHWRVKRAGKRGGVYEISFSSTISNWVMEPR